VERAYPAGFWDAFKRLPRGDADAIETATLFLEADLAYAVKSGELKDHPLRGVQLLRKPNVRRMVLDEGGFQRLFASAEEALQPILLLAFDTGMRRRKSWRSAGSR
jgi:hypothetical protein